MKQNPPGIPGMRIDISQAQDIVCEQCQHDVFVQATMMKKLSALVSPNGQEALIPIPVFACMACGHVNEMFLPKTNI
jgi:uncharacterized Zn finger protein